MNPLNAVLNVLFPASCIGCEYVGSGLCLRCAPHDANLQEQMHGLSLTALGPYAGILRTAVLALKDGRRDVARSLGELLAQRVALDGMLVPVPTTWRRRAVRGFDQALLIARAYAHVRGNPIVPALERSSDRAQHGRTRRDRLAADGRFYVRDAALVCGKSIVLIDDVVTTGASLLACAASLRAAGASVGAAIAVARTLKSG